METFKCLIVDDEPFARSVLEKFIKKISSLELAHQCYNAFDAVSYLHNNHIDIMFLDINMPDFTGLEMLKTLQKPPKVIITTAYSEFAVESYEYSVIDYLLKPFSFERFLKAINKVVNSEEKEKTPRIDSSETKTDHIFIKVDRATHKVNLSEVCYFEAYGNYIKIYLLDKKLMVYEKMHEIESKLPKEDFIRVHKSYMVAINKIDKIEGNRIFILNTEIPIGQTYKKDLEARISR